VVCTERDSGDCGRFESCVSEGRDAHLRRHAAFIDRRMTGLAFPRCRLCC
jgi:hypothetical protein